MGKRCAGYKGCTGLTLEGRPCASCLERVRKIDLKQRTLHNLAVSKGWATRSNDDRDHLKKRIGEERYKQLLAEYIAQSGTAGGAVKRPNLTAKDRERYRKILGPAVKQSADVTSQERNKPFGPRQSQNVWLTEIEENAIVRDNGWKCFGCASEYGTHIDVGNKHYVKVEPEQMHVTKTRKMGGTKQDVRMGCGTCNDIHGNGEGMSDADFKAMINREHEKRGYRNVKLVEVAA